VRRGRRLAFVEVKSKSGDRYGHPAEMVGEEKQRRLVRAAESWLAAHPECGQLEASFEVVAFQDGRIVRLRNVVMNGNI
jgi:putative endonuclease